MIRKMNSGKCWCSFCGKSQDEVANIIAGTPQRSGEVPKTMTAKSAFICDECVRRYSRLVAGTGTSRGPETIQHKDLTL
jgi:hypothetical protein